MRRILLKESEIRNYVRQLIREAMETEGHASQKTIDKWLNATPEEISTWTPKVGQNPSEFAALQKMALRQPYDRTHLEQFSRDIEDAWRRHNGLPSLKTLTDPNTGKRLRKIKAVDANGNPVFGSQTQEQKAESNRASSRRFNNSDKAVAKREEKEKAKKLEQQEQERIAKEAAEAQERARVEQWCKQNNIDPDAPNATELYLNSLNQEVQNWLETHGLDEFSYKALKTRKDWLEKKIEETEGSSDDDDKRIHDSCLYVLKDVKRQLRQYFTEDGLPKGRNLRKIEPELLTNDELNKIGQEGKAAAEQGIKAEFDAQQAEYNKKYAGDRLFMKWCKEHGCDPKPSTEKVYEKYSMACYEWCNDNGLDFTSEAARNKWKEEFEEQWIPQIQYADQQGKMVDNTTANQTIENNIDDNNKVSSNKKDDYEEEIIDDNDFGRGDEYLRNQLGYFDNPDEIDMDEFMNWCNDNEINTNDEAEMEDAMEEYKRMMGIY